MLTRKVAQSVLLLALAVAFIQPTQAAAAHGRVTLYGAMKPALRFINLARFRLAVEGKGWTRRGRVALTVVANGMTQGKVIRATKSGAFRVGVNNVSGCGATIRAQDLSFHVVLIRTPMTDCAHVTNPPVPNASVVEGAIIIPHVVQTSGSGTRNVMLLRRGDEFSLWEAGSDRPAFTPHVDSAYLDLITRDISPQPGCTAGSCPLGITWTWMAMKAGDTSIDLSPGCRLSSPACGMPDSVQRIQIDM